MVDFDTALPSAKRKALIFGILGALLSSPFSLLGGALSGTCCFLMSFVGALAVIIIPAIAGFAAAMMMDWEAAPPGAGVGVGASLGVRAGAIAALLGALLSWLVFTGFTLIMDIIQAAASDDLTSTLIGLVVTNIFSLLINAVVCFVAALIGVALGAAGGAIAGAIRGKAAN